MDDMNPFERLVSGEVTREMGPSRPVDPAAVFATAVPAEPPKWRFPSVFGAVRFVVAGALVALFGGLLLTGVLTQPGEEVLPVVGASPSASAHTEVIPEPTLPPGASTTSDVLPGVDLVTEKIEPGVFRIISDGHRDMAWDSDPASFSHFGATVAGRDGSVWNFTLPVAPDDTCHTSAPDDPATTYGCMTFYRLGAPETHRLTDGSVLFSEQIGPDGTVWARVDGELRSFDGTAWETHDVPENFGLWGHVLDRDGSIWASWPDPLDRERRGRLTEEGWEISSPGPSRGNRPVMFAGADGDVFIAYHDGVIRRVDEVDRTSKVAEAEGLDLGNSIPRQGGAAFWWMIAPDESAKRLVRYAGAEFTSYDNPLGGEGQVRGVGPDGAAWLAGGLLSLRCDGIVRFDGTEATRFLGGRCPVSTTIAADGSVWVQAVATDERQSQATDVDTYVITPAAVTAAE